MRTPARAIPVRALLFALSVGALVLVNASIAAAAPNFGAESFYAANCNAASKECNRAATPAEEKTQAEHQVYGQAAGHPPFGVTDFKLNRVEASPGLFVPVQSIKNLRIDVAPGVSTNPEAVPMCSKKEFEGNPVEPVPGVKAFTAPNCPGSEIGENKVLTVIEVAPGVHADVPLSGKVYNLKPTEGVKAEGEEGLSSYFGVALSAEPLFHAPLYFHTFINGHIEWASDYHDYFKINNITPGLLESRLTFFGNIGAGGFLTNPSNCAGPGPKTTTGWSGESYEGAHAFSSYTVPLGTEGCNGLSPFTPVPFAPTFNLTPENTRADQPDGVKTELAVPHNPHPAENDSSQLQNATVVLPEGMTLSPSAAHSLQACTPAQIGIHTRNPVTCPEASKVASATLEVPGLPPGSLTGALYLGGPEGGGAITGPPYTVYLLAESTTYGISVRLAGQAVPNETTGRVSVTFAENPEQPFSNLILQFTGGPTAALANPLICGTATTNTVLTPFTGQAAATPTSAFTINEAAAGGSCATPPPFALTQATSVIPTTGGSHSAFTLTLQRGDGQQYLSQVSAKLPPGLIGLIPAVPLCGEPQAAQGACPAASQIGTATVLSGSGTTPSQFSGPVYLTGPTNGAPYGMVVAVNVATGPFNLGTVVVRPTINVNPYTAQITVSGTLPTIVKGVPVRLRNLTMAISRPGFLVNPTNCSVLATETALLSTLGATQNVSTPFQLSDCSSLPFKPKFTAGTSARNSKHNGASLTVKIGYPSGVQANIRSVVAQLPRQLPSRLTTLQKACPEAVFNANPFACPSGSRVGGATATTPALPNKLTGPAYFVSHGGRAFPDLDLVLTGNNLEVILVGNTNITGAITTSTFAAVPDVPVSSFELNLPTGPNSALTANGANLCAQALVMPTTITAQSGAVIKQNTKISVSSCQIRVTKRRTSGRTVSITVQTPAAGRVSVSGSRLRLRYRFASRAQKLTISTSYSGSTPRRVRVRLGFLPRKKGAPSSTAFTTVTFR